MARSIFFYTDSAILGGAEESLLMLIETLDPAAWSPTLVLGGSDRSPLVDRARAIGVPVRMISPMPLGIAGGARVPAFIRTLRRERPDVFHAQLSSPLAAKYALAGAVVARVPAVVGTVQLVPPFELDRSSLLQLRALAAGVGRYLAVSRDIARQLVDRLGWPESKVEVVYNAVRSARSGSAEARALRDQLTGGRERPVVLTCARLDAQKGHRVLLEAAAELPGVLFVLAGEGPERAALTAQASALGVADRVMFLGHRSDVPQLLAASDVFALPSLYEGSSLALLEAMAAGQTVVSSAIPGTDELIAHGETGLLVPPGDARALTQALRRVLDDEHLRTALGAEARQRVTRDFTAAAMARSVTRVYEELLGDTSATVVEPLPERQRNALLRRVDWRFLLRQSARPRTLNLAEGRLGQAVSLISDPPTAGADLVVLESPRRKQLEDAHAALRAGGELYAEWRLPMLARAWRVRRALSRTDFVDIRLLWPGPRSGRALPQFWLPLESGSAVAHLLADRPVRARREAVIRGAWGFAARAGALAPLSVIARRPGPPEAPEAQELDAPIEDARSSPASWLLLTGGERSINKVVGLALSARNPEPRVAVKFARVPASEPALEHEARVLRALERERPALQGVPRVLGVGRRAGMLAVAETAVHGSPLLPTLTATSFPRLATDVTRWLIQLAGSAPAQPRAAWWRRLVQDPVDEFERQFGSVVGTGAVAQARSLLDELADLPLIFEHRDCSPWNIVLTAAGTPALLDWESAEPSGLPVLDLVYFLANAAFVIEDALETGCTREAYARLLDPSTPSGRIAVDCMAEYCSELGLDLAAVSRLRLLCWIVHSRSDFRHLSLDGGAPAPAALRGSVFLGLAQAELGAGRSDV